MFVLGRIGRLPVVGGRGGGRKRKGKRKRKGRGKEREKEEVSVEGLSFVFCVF